MSRMKFSQRKGFTNVSDVIQKDRMTNELRNSLWNILHLLIFLQSGFMSSGRGDSPKIYEFARSLWFGYYKKPIDALPDSPGFILKEIRNYFFSCNWFEVYDFLEFILDQEKDRFLKEALNGVLEQELSGYRFIDGICTDITDETEIEMLETALVDVDFPGVRAHLRRSLDLLSDKKKPDYRNSIKEAISAVESICLVITNNPKATLGDALKTIEGSGKLHPALKEAFLKLYGYTSDEQGIRHAMLEEPNLTQADAKYFLLSCTSFINYLKTKI